MLTASFWVRVGVLLCCFELLRLFVFDSYASFPQFTGKEKSDECKTSLQNSILEYVHIPKTGGSALERAAAMSGIRWGACHYVELPELGCCRSDLQKPLGIIAPWHYPPKLLQQEEAKLNSTATLFTVIRDPYSICVSEFYAELEDYAEFHEVTANSSVMNNWIQEQIKARHPQADRRLHSSEETRFYPQHRYVYDDDGTQIIPHVLHYETLQTEFSDLMEKYDLLIHLPNKSEVSLDLLASKMTVANLTAETIALINEYYIDDFHKFGYKALDPTKSAPISPGHQLRGNNLGGLAEKVDQLEAPVKGEESDASPLLKGSETEASTQSTAASDTRIQLQVPFYVYEEPAINWEGATYNNALYGTGKTVRSIKHKDDYWFLQAALRHPMRTRNPDDAKLFFVPSFMNLVMEFIAAGRKGQVCTQEGKVCSSTRTWNNHLKILNDALGNSKYFQRSNGTDHVIVSSHWQTQFHYKWLGRFLWDYPNINKCNSMLFEDFVPKAAAQYPRIRLPGLYMGNRCEHLPKKADFAMIATIKDDPRFQVRKDICNWLSSPGSEKASKYSVSQCGFGAQCPALAEAKFGFHARGDTWGSNRLMDTLISRTVPLFTNQKQLDIVPSFYPWDEVSFMVNTSTKASFQKSLDDVLSRTDEYEKKMQRIDELLYLFDHTDVFQFDIYMAQFAMRLGFQS